VFAAGSAVHATRMAVVAVGSARTAAHAITAFLEGRPIGPRRRPFTTLSSGLKPDDIRQMAALAGSKPRQQPSCPDGGLSDEEAGDECARCLHCDCRKVDTCRLRTTAVLLGASPNRLAGEHRGYACDATHPLIIYESGKCILCGLCVRLAQARGMQAGPALTGHGYATTMRAPFDRPLSEALPADAAEFVAICPTGALSLKKDAV
jgi:ferredoxin